MLLLLGFAFLAGVFTAFSPCILPVLPAILSAGVAKGRLRPLGTILGLIFSFSFFTLSLTWLVHTTGLSPYILRYIAIVLIFFFGLVMIFPKLSNWFAVLTNPVATLGQKIQDAQPHRGFWGGIVFGLALGLLWTPCAGPILAAITTLVASHSINLTTVLMTLCYSLGAGIPLFLVAYGSARLIHASHLLSRHAERIRQFFGLLMILFALILLFNWDMLINQKLSRFTPELLSESSLGIEQHLNDTGQQTNLVLNEPAPQLKGLTAWINSPALTLDDLKGKVVLIDFWTYSCINCLRTLPYLENWYQTYKDQGLVIIGVHTPEFEFEKNENNVKKAVKQLGVEYPVALDNNYETWNAYHNHYWPAHFLIDQKGILRGLHFGEGAYVQTENSIRMLLGLAPLSKPEPLISTRPISPETYLGSSRGHSYQMPISANKTMDYSYQPPLSEGKVGLKGPWLIKEEFIVAQSTHSYLDYHFLATRVYLVLSGSSKTPLEVILDGQVVGQLKIDGDRKYDIVTTSYGRHQLSLKVPKGIQCYAFTFGDE